MKVLFVGLGGIGQRHLRNLRSIVGDNLDVIAFRERNSSSVISDTLTIEEGSNVEQFYGVTVYSSLIDALAQGPSIAFICNPTSMHLATAKLAIEHGCHLFIEKELSDSLDGVQ